jgi:hypothetical protein
VGLDLHNAFLRYVMFISLRTTPKSIWGRSDLGERQRNDWAAAVE